VLVQGFELLPVTLRALAAVDVVAEHRYEVKGKILAAFCHLDGPFVLVRMFRPAIANNNESNGVPLDSFSYGRLDDKSVG
jgi:hypothetical protein